MTKVTDLADADLLRVYIKLRDVRAQRKQAFTDSDTADRVKQDRVEAELLARFQKRGIDALSANGIGTAYKSTRSSATVADWDAFFGHVLANKAFELLERRVNKTAVVQFKNEHDDLPPGVNWSEIVTVNVRRN